MKKLIYLCLAVLSMTFASCEKDEIGGTATQVLAGEWYVTVDQADADGNVIAPDVYGLGKFLLNTYNTAANVDNQMWLDDNGSFWNFKIKLTSDIKNLSFTTNGEVQDTKDPDCKVTIDGGKVLPKAGLTPHGTAADSIVFYVSFSNDEPDVRYKVSGIRYTGLTQDD